MESFDAGDEGKDLQLAATHRGWARPVATLAALVTVALLLDVLIGRYLTPWTDLLIANVGGFLVIVTYLFVFVGMRNRLSPSGY